MTRETKMHQPFGTDNLRLFTLRRFISAKSARNTRQFQGHQKDWCFLARRKSLQMVAKMTSTIKTTSTPHQTPIQPVESLEESQDEAQRISQDESQDRRQIIMNLKMNPKRNHNMSRRTSLILKMK